MASAGEGSGEKERKREGQHPCGERGIFLEGLGKWASVLESGNTWVHVWSPSLLGCMTLAKSFGPMESNRGRSLPFLSPSFQGD